MMWRYALKDIHAVARDFWKNKPGAKVYAFHGAMGSGKTTFIHALCDVKNVRSVVGSPTFSIINQYEYPEGIIYHVDLYRLTGEEEVIRAGVEECLFSGEYCLVEWPERATRLFPDNTVHAFMEAVSEESRLISIGDK